MTKEDKSFLLFAAGVTIIFFGYIFRDMTVLAIGLWVLAINQWFVFYRKKKKEKFYLVNYGLNWSTLKMFWGMIKGKGSHYLYSEELPNIKKQ